MLESRVAKTESTLIELAQNGDRDAYGDLVRSHHAFVIRIVFRMCSDAALAEDAAQEAFLRAWVKLPAFNTGLSFRNWLCRIALNAALDTLRLKKDTHPANEQLENLPDNARSPEAVLIEKQETEILQQALRSLPEASRSVIVLREYGGLTYDEIANVLEIPMGTVMSRLNYARGKLREVLVAEKVEQEQEYA